MIGHPRGGRNRRPQREVTPPPHEFCRRTRAGIWAYGVVVNDTSSYLDMYRPGNRRSRACSAQVRAWNIGEFTRSRISTKLSSAKSAMTSVFSLRRSW